TSARMNPGCWLAAWDAQPPGLAARLRTTLTLAAALIAALLSGCAVGPDYHRPAALATNAMPAAFGDAAVTNTVEWKPAEPSAHLPRGAWGELYRDEEWTRLESLAATNNQEISGALANFEGARAAVKTARADAFPQVNATPSIMRVHTSGQASPASSLTRKSETFTTYTLTADASWELDLWGRIRRGVEAARGRFQASGDDLEALRLSVQAEVAIDYFTLRALDAQTASLAQTVTAYERALELTENRRRSGVAGELDVAQAETQL